MMDIENFTAILKELGYLNDSEKNKEKENHADDKSESQSDRKEDDRKELG